MDTVETSNTTQSKEGRRRRYLATAIVLAVIVFIIWWLLQQIGHVPNTIGLSPQRSRTLINTSGFQSSVTTVPAVVGQEGRVILQTPSSGWRFVWWPVKIVVSAYRSQAMSRGVPISKIDNVNWPEMRKATVTEVMPSDPEEMDSRSSAPETGNRQVMIDVQGETRNQAVRDLQAAGFNAVIHYGPSTTQVPVGRVYYQKPAPGALLTNQKTAIIWITNSQFRGKDIPYTGFPYPGPDHKN